MLDGQTNGDSSWLTNGVGAVAYKWVADYFIIVVGTVLVAAGLDIFLVPNKIAAGGVSGIATILHFTISVPVGAAILFLNVPLFIFSIYRLGFRFGARSLFGTVVLSLAVDVMAPFLPVFTRDVLLASLFGGVLTGLGLGLVFRSKGTTGGTDLAAAVLRSYVGINIGQLLFVVDGLVVLSAGIVFHSAELAMYALISIFVTARVIDLVQEGFGFAKAFLIISDRAEEIGNDIMYKLDRGATLIRGRGLYTGRERPVILSVVGRSEVSKLKETVYRIDPDAFVILADVHEVLGEGFKRHGSI